MAKGYEYRTDYENFKTNLLQVSYLKHIANEDSKGLVHSHDFSEIFLIVNGNGKFNSYNNNLVISRGDVIFINSHIEHCEYNIKDLEYYVLCIKGIKFDLNDSNFLFKLNNTDFENFYMMFNLIFKELQQKKENSIEVADNLCKALVLQLTRNLKISKHETNNLILPPEIAIVKEYIDSDIRIDSLEDLAKIARMDKYNFIRTFKKYLGCSPVQYLLNSKIEVAKRKLIYTNQSISTIVSIIQFSSISNFNKKFKEYTGLTPKEFRTQNKQFI